MSIDYAYDTNHGSIYFLRHTRTRTRTRTHARMSCIRFICVFRRGENRKRKKKKWLNRFEEDETQINVANERNITFSVKIHQLNCLLDELWLVSPTKNWRIAYYIYNDWVDFSLKFQRFPVNLYFPHNVISILFHFEFQTFAYLIKWHSVCVLLTILTYDTLTLMICNLNLLEII